MSRWPKRSEYRLPTEGRYEQIADALRHEIRTTRRPGERLASENVLAKQYGVGVNTLRQALAVLVQEGWLERRRGSGTYVCEPSAQANRHIGILIELDISHPGCSHFWLRSTQSLRQLLRDCGRQVRLYVGHAVPGAPPPRGSTCPEFLQAVERDEIEGLVALSGAYHASWGQVLRKRNVPMVGDAGALTCRVIVDYPAMVAAGLAHLDDAGCERIAVLGWGLSSQALSEVFAARGLRHRPAWTPLVTHPHAHGAGYAEVRALWNAHGEKPDGLLICDELLLQNAVAAVTSLSVRVPGDLALVTHAIRGSALFVPVPVTKMAYDPDVFADLAGRQLLACLAGEATETTRTVLPFQWETNQADLELSA